MSNILLSTQLQGQGRQSGNNMTKTGYLPETARQDRKWRSPEDRQDQPGTDTQNIGKERKCLYSILTFTVRVYDDLICHQGQF